MRASFILVAMTLAGCSLIGLEHNDPPPVVPSGEPEGILVVNLDAQADGAGITVEESLRQHLGGDAVLVRGVLFIDDAVGTMWLCQGQFSAELARQPSCERPALLLQHPDAAGLQLQEMNADLLEAGRVGTIQEFERVRWAEDAFFYGHLLEAVGNPPGPSVFLGSVAIPALSGMVNRWRHRPYHVQRWHPARRGLAPNLYLSDDGDRRSRRSTTGGEVVEPPAY
jgi:hypothetical protein